MVCKCLEILCDFLKIADLARIIQNYVHNPRQLYNYTLDHFELHARYSKYRGPNGLRVCTNNDLMGTVPKYFPYSEISITPWQRQYHLGGRKGIIAASSRIVLSYVENSSQKYVSATMLLPLLTKNQRKKFTDKLFIRNGYSDFMRLIRWPGLPNNSGTPQHLEHFLGNQFHEVYNAIVAAIDEIKQQIVHVKMPITICTTS